MWWAEYHLDPAGLTVLVAGGTAVDAAVGAMFCDGVYNSHSMGLGGGFLLTFYNRTERRAVSLTARERAPAAASQDMFGRDPDLASKGGLAVAVPGEVAGYWEARRRHGNPAISWERIIRPTLQMCRDGIPVSKT